MNKDNLATSREVSRPPDRIVSLTPSASELICILGGMDKIVGRDDHSSFPPGLDEKPPLGSGVRRTIRVEEVLDLDPDVVVAGRHIQPETFEKIESAGVPVVVVGTSCETESLIKNVRSLGEMMDAREILSRPELKKTDAVRKQKVYVSHLSLRRGPRLVGYLLYLARWFHPELFMDIDPAAVEREMLRKFYGINLEGSWAYPEI
ncbi:MAG: Periplasmic binding protein [Methanothrix harundinacea]|uniref:Periplasmic binding protein n=1 Tax=Methanothrix harundinacea TaxID=301375 RepID=A0A101FUZ8_9EURY|nr:MAG: Periplasmic binding protein [Methanothrix harundinacea]